MDDRLKVFAPWFLVLVTLATTSLIVFISLMGLMLWPDRSLVAAFRAIGVNPRATIEFAHLFEFLLVILVWVVPSASVIGFAVRKRQCRALSLGLSVSVLLFAAVCFFSGLQNHSIVMKCLSITSATVVLSALVVSFLKSNFLRSLTIGNVFATLLLFGPSLSALSSRTMIPQAKELWTTTLQQDQWQSMNTGSEYAATRQLAFAGACVVAVFDAGFGPSRPTKEKWPVSAYRLVSLDAKSGTKLKEITIEGRWGVMPYIYPTPEGFIDVQSNPPRTLDADLVPVTNAYKTDRATRTQTRDRLECGGANCDPRTYVLANNTIQLRQNRFQVVDNTGHALSSGDLVDWGTFAGASADGRRFAIQSSYTEGDPYFVVYEYFTVYDSATGKALATVHTKNLPARQSWSAFSEDGRYFVMGNPNKLTMYELF